MYESTVKRVAHCTIPNVITTVTFPTKIGDKIEGTNCQIIDLKSGMYFNGQKLISNVTKFPGIAVRDKTKNFDKL